MKDSSFYLSWTSFLVCVVFGIFGFIYVLITARIDRRDKIFSGLLGCAIGTAINFILWKNGFGI
jgi:hypothetical protein